MRRPNSTQSYWREGEKLVPFTNADEEVIASTLIEAFRSERASHTPVKCASSRAAMTEWGLT